MVAKPLPDAQVDLRITRNNETAEASYLRSDRFSLLPERSPEGRLLPIPYQLKVSAKARQVYLRVEPGRGLQVSIPRRYSKRSIPALVESQRAWITEALEDLDAKTPELYRQWPPRRLDLIAKGTSLHIDYTDTPGKTTAQVRQVAADQLQINVDVTDKPLVAECIASALKPLAREVLGPMLARRAKETSLFYKRMVIRGQRTVWGSYSSTGTLSLNYKLLFVNPDLLDYVLLHELAHIRHLDHSAAFWRFLDGLKPNAREYDKELSDAGQVVPPWLELAGTR